MAALPLLTIQDLASYLQIPVATIYRWNSRGAGPAYRKVGKYVRYRPEDVERWLQSQPDG